MNLRRDLNEQNKSSLTLFSSRSDPTGGWVSLAEGRGLEETEAMHPDIRALNADWLKQRYSRR